MSEGWMKILEEETRKKGNATVARELGISASAVSLVLSGKYPASTDKIEKRIMGIYGADGMIDCPILGLIKPDKCATSWERAKKIGMKAGNPATIRLYKACAACELRN